jgi:hypothetical protein
MGGPVMTREGEIIDGNLIEGIQINPELDRFDNLIRRI